MKLALQLDVVKGLSLTGLEDECRTVLALDNEFCCSHGIKKHNIPEAIQ
jgi:hypothetical protein